MVVVVAAAAVPVGVAGVVAVLWASFCREEGALWRQGVTLGGHHHPCTYPGFSGAAFRLVCNNCFWPIHLGVEGVGVGWEVAAEVEVGGRDLVGVRAGVGGGLVGGWYRGGYSEVTVDIAVDLISLCSLLMDDNGTTMGTYTIN